MRLNAILRIIFNGIFIIFVVTGSTEVSCLVVDKIVAVVNGEVITQREITQLLIPVYEQYKKEYTGRRLEDKMLEAEDTVLDQLIDEKLILSEAKRQGIEATDKEVEIKLQAIKTRFDTEEEFRETLARQDISLTQLRDRFKGDIIKSKLVRKVIGWKIVITPCEVRRYYDNHVEDFIELEKRRVLNLLIKKSDVRTDDEARFLIRKIRELIKSGEDFEELAKEYSEGPNAKAGGDLGVVEKGQMIREIDDAIFSLDAGGISGVVESPIGYHIFKVTKKIPEEIIDFEPVKPEIEDLIYREKIDNSLKTWLKELRKNAYISIK